MPWAGRISARCCHIGALWRLWCWTALCLVLKFARPLGAEESSYWVKTWNADDGLRAHTILTIAQTTDGYLWMSSFSGLTRFDGLNFKTFDIDSTPVLGTRAIGSISGDSAGRLWVANFRSELLLHDGESFRKIGVPGVGSGTGDSVSTFLELEPGVLAIVTARGRTHLWRNGQVELDGGAQYGIPKGAIGMSGGDHIARYFGRKVEGTNFAGLSEFGTIESGQFKVAESSDHQTRFRILMVSSEVGGEIAAMCVEPDGISIRYLRPRGQISAPRKLPFPGGDGIMSLEADSFHNFWIGTRQFGVVRVGPSGDREEFSARQGMGSSIVRYIFRDSEDNIWAATEGGGISRISRRAFRPLAGSSGIVQSVLPDGEKGLWIATHGHGLVHSTGGEVVPFPGTEDFAYSLHRDLEGDLWIGGLTAGLYRARGANVTFLAHLAPIRAICDDPAGGVWVAGPQLLHSDGGEAVPVPGWPGKEPVSALASGRDGTLWVGTMGEGIWERKGEHYRNYRRIDGLPHDEIHVLYADTEGVLWIGGPAGGLGRLKAGRITRVTVADGLKDDSIAGIGEDLKGNFWFTSGAGISRVKKTDLERFLDGDPHPVASFEYNKNDGLRTIQSSSGSQPKISLAPDGRMFFATMDGVAVVDPATMPVYTNPPPVVIQEIFADRVPLPKSPQKGVPTARAGTRLLEIRYAGIALAAPDKVKYKYKLEGRDSDWTEAGGRRFAEFDRLQPGGYRFRVIAANGDGIWNKEGATLAFAVAPFFWQTLRFELAMAGLVVVASIGVIRYLSEIKFRRRLVLLEREQAVQAERARIARDMHDDLGSSLTQITMLGALAHEDLGEAGRASGYLEQLRDVSMEVIGKMDELVWVVNPRNDSTAALTDYLTQFASQYLKLAGVQLRIDIPPGLPTATLSADSRHQIYLVFKEALNNVVKHSRATEVWLRASAISGFLCITVEDNGRGFEPSQSRSGADGLGNMRQRLEALGGKCVIESASGSGTKVQLHIPYATAV